MFETGHPAITFFGCDREEALAVAEASHRYPVRCRVESVPVGPVSAALAVGTTCVSVSHVTAVTAETLHALAANGVRSLITRSIGVDHLDLEAAAALGISVANVGYEPDGVADHTVMLILLALRNTRPTLAAVARHDFRAPVARGRELRSVTVAVIGGGRIGCAVAERLRPFGCRVLIVGGSGPAPEGTERVPLEQALAASDVLTLHLPLSDMTHHFLSAERIARLRPGALVVNTGRGGLIDTDALVAALEDGRLGGAALDVVEGEEGCFSVDHSGRPLPHGSLERLIAMPNVVITPHLAYFTTRTLHQIIETTLSLCVTHERTTIHV
ncbi:NAD(P)-dependent oxidoreductase [Rathayibacter rathayi]|uniref:NAD(P)-dependent oxidoreductase n=2 Tax=Rathayibacter rathayi TaxID=33887 RepID=UPI000CE84F38|nr:NAD(P)-dependent oxidoreductase [Rathayibacter rathayi]PPG41887.1 lactate dehydrogenase [Rathayibacter rathayi]PPH32172.1 lactate dehydrogenase [Rathayibacter rathayi]PPI75985.1 lactate dehydrogenase [Rathayibacter rathayi]